MEILLVVSTVCLCGIFACLMSFEKRTQILMKENQKLSGRVKALEKESYEVQKFYKLFYASKGVKQ